MSITTKKLIFNCFVSDISLAGFENRTFDWLDLKMFQSIVLVLPSDWFSLSGWPRFRVSVFFTECGLHILHHEQGRYYTCTGLDPASLPKVLKKVFLRWTPLYECSQRIWRRDEQQEKDKSLSKISVVLIHMKSSTFAGFVFGRCQLTLTLPSLK